MAGYSILYGAWFDRLTMNGRILDGHWKGAQLCSPTLTNLNRVNLQSLCMGLKIRGNKSVIIPNLKLSILDQSPVHGSETPTEALGRTIELAQRAEEWGYHRFWVAEHHGSSRVMGSSPEILVSHLLAHTSSIRVGSGGVMLQHYSPYKVAENFNMLSSLAPGRVDLGIGRGPGGLPRSTAALRRGVLRQAQDEPSAGQGGQGAAQDERETRQGEQGAGRGNRDTGQGERGAGRDERDMTLEEKLVELRQFLADELEPEHPLYGLQASPMAPQPPELFLLGTTRSSGDMAAEMGMPYVFALFLNNDEEEMAEAVRRYQSGFALRQAPGDAKGGGQPSPSGRGGQPYTMLALPIIVADSDEEAAEHAAKIQVVRIRLDSGRTLTVGSVEAGEEFGRQSGEGYEIMVRQAGVEHGAPESVRAQLLDMQRKYDASEIIAVTAIDSFKKRLRSFELLGGLIK